MAMTKKEIETAVKKLYMEITGYFPDEIVGAEVPDMLDEIKKEYEVSNG
jgi:hypothetical protein